GGGHCGCGRRVAVDSRQPHQPASQDRHKLTPSVVVRVRDCRRQAHMWSYGALMDGAMLRDLKIRGSSPHLSAAFTCLGRRTHGVAEYYVRCGKKRCVQKRETSAVFI
uniref:Uncharacterized protein n=1 Tax=Aegilops tauschii subsp. strangulata TaxID=200361 RepID=A0A453ICV6_AEGTS